MKGGAGLLLLVAAAAVGGAQSYFLPGCSEVSLEGWRERGSVTDA